MYNRRYSKPKPRTIVAKFAGTCACCAAPIAAGEMCDYYPAGTIAGVNEGRIAHVGGLDGNSGRCSTNIAARNSYSPPRKPAKYDPRGWVRGVNCGDVRDPGEVDADAWSASHGADR